MLQTHLQNFIQKLKNPPDPKLLQECSYVLQVSGLGQPRAPKSARLTNVKVKMQNKRRLKDLMGILKEYSELTQGV